MIDLKSVTDGKADLFASAGGRKSADYSEYVPVLKLSLHQRDDQGRGAIKSFPSTWAEFAEHTKGLRWAAREQSCSVSVRWAPADAKRHAAILKTIAETAEGPQREKVQERLDALEGSIHFRTIPPQFRPRAAGATAATATA